MRTNNHNPHEGLYMGALHFLILLRVNLWCYSVFLNHRNSMFFLKRPITYCSIRSVLLLLETISNLLSSNIKSCESHHRRPLSTLFNLKLTIHNNIFSQVLTSLAENQPPKEWISHLLKVSRKEMNWCGWRTFLIQGRLTRSWTSGTTTTPSPGAGPAWAKTTSLSPSGPSTTLETGRSPSPPSNFDRLHWV